MKGIPQIYLASGWFNPEQMKQMNEVYEVLKKLEDEKQIRLFAPYYDGIVLKKDDPGLKKKMRIVWDLDIDMVKKSDLVIACTQDHDVGTIFECGYASCAGKIILCYNSNPELGLNVMLAQEARGFCKNQADVLKAVQAFIVARQKDDVEDYRFNLWEGEPI